MIVGGFSYVGTLARPTTPSPAQNSPGTQTWALQEEGDGMKENPTYFRAISAISPGSLAAVYQAMRAHEHPVTSTPQASALGSEKEAPGAGSSAARILSGQGIPSAMSAYSEVMETASE